VGFAAGFAKGWSNEMDRQERRKEFQAALNEKRMGTLAEVMARRAAYAGAGGGSAGTGSDAGGSGGASSGTVDANHYSDVLVSYGMTPDTVAEISKKGPYALKIAADTIEKNPDAIWTPETFAKMPGAIIVTEQKTGTVDVDGVIRELYGEEFLAQMDPVERELLGYEAMVPPKAPLVSNTYNPQQPLKQEVLNATVEAANATLIAELTARKEQYDEQIQNGATDEDKAAAAERSQYFEGLITEVGENNVIPAIREVGAEIIGPYLENNPQLKSNPQMLGVWAPAADAYLNPPAQEAQAAPQQTTQGNNFATKEEALRAIKDGKVAPGGTFYINGQGPYENDL